MRILALVLVLCFAIVACTGTDPIATVDASPDGLASCAPGRVAECDCIAGITGGGTRTCGTDGVYGTCVCPVGPDAEAMDVALEVGVDAPAAPDVIARDVVTEAADVYCPFGLAAPCTPGGPTLNLRGGLRQSDGTITNCGRCGNVCELGQGCDCRCYWPARH